MRHPVVLSSLEEDFKALGLAEKTEEAAPADPVKTEEAQLDEVKKTRTKRATAGMRRKWRMAKKKGGAKAAARKYRRKGSVKKMLKKHRMKAAKLRKGKAAGRTRLVFGDSQVANMLEDVKNVLSNLDENKVDTAVKSFANLAIIAEMLGEFFASYSEEVEGEMSEELKAAAEYFAEMAEEAAEIASALHEGDDADLPFDEIEEAFQEQMSSLVDGLELYADLNEEDDCDDDDEDDDDDDDDEEDMDESAASPSMKEKLEAVKNSMKKKMGKGY